MFVQWGNGMKSKEELLYKDGLCDKCGTFNYDIMLRNGNEVYGKCNNCDNTWDIYVKINK